MKGLCFLSSATMVRRRRRWDTGGRYEKASSFQGLVFLQQWEALRLAFARRIHSFWTRYKAQ